jgi:hypothetical protein
MRTLVIRKVSRVEQNDEQSSKNMENLEKAGWGKESDAVQKRE